MFIGQIRVGQARCLPCAQTLKHRLSISTPEPMRRQISRPGKRQREKVEFELFSRNFMEHQHDPKGCDIIVCWVHN